MWVCLRKITFTTMRTCGPRERAAPKATDLLHTAGLTQDKDCRVAFGKLFHFLELQFLDSQNKGGANPLL